MKKRDASNKYFVRSPHLPESEMYSEDKKIREKPLRGYLKREDYEQMQLCREFLYGDYDVDRLERDVRIGLKRHSPEVHEYDLG